MKYALVTGGSRGIGRAVCVRLARMGYHVLVNCVNRTDEAEHTLELVRQEGQDGEVLKFDVGNRVQVSAVLEAWMEKHPEEYIEVLVNNAGVRRDNLMVFMPGEDWDSVLGTGLGGFYNVTQPLLQPMLVHKFGRIVNMASVSGLRGMPGQANYSAAKGVLAVVHLMDIIKHEDILLSIQVIIVVPLGGRTCHHPYTMFLGESMVEYKIIIPQVGK